MGYMQNQQRNFPPNQPGMIGPNGVQLGKRNHPGPPLDSYEGTFDSINLSESNPKAQRTEQIDDKNKLGMSQKEDNTESFYNNEASGSIKTEPKPNVTGQKEESKAKEVKEDKGSSDEDSDSDEGGLGVFNKGKPK